MMYRHRVVPWVTLVAGLLFAGCSSNQYEIELKPAGKSVERTLTCWNVAKVEEGEQVGAFSADELQRIAAAYHAPVPEKLDQKHAFSARFSGRLPSDLGGSGSYTHWTTSLGSVSAYVERLRGNDDLLAIIEERQQTVDRIVDLLVGWLQAEHGDKPEILPLRNFLQADFRRDLKNLSLYVWTITLSAEEDTVAQQQGLIRAGQYLVERGYFAPEELPAWTRAVADGSDPKPLLVLVRKALATKTGLSTEVDFLTDLDRLRSSMNEHLRDTDEYREMLENWRRGEHPPGEQEPEPVEVFGDLLIEAFLPEFHLGPSDQVRVKLAAGVEPFATNGVWNADDGSVTWSRSMARADADSPGVPQVIFAAWSQPAEQAQRQHFGKLVLAGESLGEYCLWHAGLSPQEAGEWDAFVARLTPGPELADRVEAFRFSFEGPADQDQQGDDLASVARELILVGLGPRE